MSKVFVFVYLAGILVCIIGTVLLVVDGLVKVITGKFKQPKITERPIYVLLMAAIGTVILFLTLKVNVVI